MGVEQEWIITCFQASYWHWKILQNSCNGRKHTKSGTELSFNRLESSRTCIGCEPCNCFENFTWRYNAFESLTEIARKDSWCLNIVRPTFSMSQFCSLVFTADCSQSNFLCWCFMYWWGYFLCGWVYLTSIILTCGLMIIHAYQENFFINVWAGIVNYNLAGFYILPSC